MARALTVLLVDDDDLVRAPVAEILENQGLRVLTAGSAIEAMRILAQRYVDVLFTDVVMPDVSGIELAKQAKQLRPDLLVIFTTGYFSRAADAAQLGKVLFKPMRAHQIQDALNDVLRPLR
jgi:DNA-binding NtrC family response regulator